MRIAHLSDMHLLEPTETPGLGARFVSLGRRLDAEGRLDKARAAVAHARANGAEHFLFTGDLTETGTPAQFEALAARAPRRASPTSSSARSNRASRIRRFVVRA